MRLLLKLTVAIGMHDVSSRKQALDKRVANTYEALTRSMLNEPS